MSHLVAIASIVEAFERGERQSGASARETLISRMAALLESPWQVEPDDIDKPVMFKLKPAVYKLDRAEGSLRALQTNLPWTVRYSQDFRATPLTHKDFTHALLHVAKALGKLTGLADDMDHDRAVADQPKLREAYSKYLADLVVCALRAANVFPGGVVDLQKAVEDRIVEKNP